MQPSIYLLFFFRKDKFVFVCLRQCEDVCSVCVCTYLHMSALECVRVGNCWNIVCRMIIVSLMYLCVVPQLASRCHCATEREQKEGRGWKNVTIKHSTLCLFQQLDHLFST